VLEDPSHRNSAVKPLGWLNSGGAFSLRATAIGGAWVHAPSSENLNKLGGLQQPPPLFLSLPTVSNVVTCKTPRTTNNNVFGSVSLFQIYSLLVFCSSLLQVAVGSEVRAFVACGRRVLPFLGCWRWPCCCRPFGLL